MKNEMKETAVEWFVDELQKADYIPRDSSIMNYVISTAKEMEKEQMIGLLQWMNRVTQSNPMRLETDDDDVVEQYYLETYGGNK